jgi:iron complex outermembrane recepter protein
MSFRTKRHSIVRAFLGSTILAATPVLAAEPDPAPVAGSDEIIVTAQKRSENLQKVPLSIQAIGTEKLDQLQVSAFEDYVKFLPSVTFQTGGPGFAKVYFRGVASGENANHSASQPTVGIYLDEQPITTIQGALDIHVYDLARVEALAGPQGTLYGASSEAGTIRLITNKPDTKGFYGGADAEINSVAHGGFGGSLESFVNVPLSDKMAVRAVGWYVHDAGYIDNIAGSRTFPTSGVTRNNAPFVKNNYNDVDTYGGRAALGIDLDDNWTITPAIIAQVQKANGSFAQESGLKKLQVQQYNPEGSKDRWAQAALTIKGALGNWDVTYAGAYLKRKVDSQADYSDYAYFYDSLTTYGAYFQDNAGNPVDPTQRIKATDRYTKQSHEFRLTSPSDQRLRFIGGLFYQRQTHNIEQNYIIDALGSSLAVPGTARNVWLTKELRVDRDYAAFGELTFDITDKLKASGGLRYYKYKNSLQGFFGYSAAFAAIAGSSTGVPSCFAPAIVAGSPCTNVDKTTKDTGVTHKLNLTYEIDEDKLVYGTWSNGFRPGGVNRRGTLPPYGADTLDNYEFGWKTTWNDRKLRWNGAIYQLKWSNIQLSFLGANGLTEIRNAGDARIRGIETDVSYRMDNLTLSAGASFNDAKTTKPFCRIANPQFDCAFSNVPGKTNELLAPTGTRLPVTSRLKANALARYEFPVSSWDGHFQLAGNYESDRTSDLRTVQRAILGTFKGYASVDLSIGVKKDNLSVELFATNLFDNNGVVNRGVQCTETICGDPDGLTASGGKFYSTIVRPRLIGLKVGTKF